MDTLTADRPTTDKQQALAALSALANETRLEVFRTLVRAGPEGMAAGAIGAALNVRQNTMSTHLAVLSRAHLIAGRREGRGIRYTARIGRMRGLIAFLLADCCAGDPERCALSIDALIPC